MLISRLKSNIRNVLFGSIVAQGINFCAIVLASWRLDLNGFGVFSAILAGHLFIVQFADFGLNVAFTKKKKIRILDLQYSNIIFVKLAGTAFVVLVALYYSVEYAAYFNLNLPNKYPLMVSIVSALPYVYFYTLNAYIQARGEYIKSFVYTSVIALARLILFLLPGSFEALNDPEVYLYLYMAPVLIPITIDYISSDIHKHKFIFCWKYVLSVSRLARWTLFSSLLVTFCAQYGTLQISRYSTSDQQGIYSIANNFAMIIPLVTNSIFVVILNEWGSFGLKLKEIGNHKNLLRYSLVLFLIWLGVSIAGYVIFSILYPANKDIIGLCFFIIVLGYVIGMVASPISIALMCNRSAYKLTFVNAIQAVIITSLGSTIVSSFGAIGASCILLVNNLVGLIIILMFVRFGTKQISCNI